MKKILLTLLGSLITLLAFANLAVACAAMGYQPEVPSQLKK